LPSELFETVKIPKERIGALIGSSGKVKRKLEKLTETVIAVDSEGGIVDIEGKGNSANFYDAVSVIKAIGRGFSPENAFSLIDEETILDVIKVSDFVGGSEKTLKTKRGRVIGKQGTARDQIEKETDAKISVFGKTIAIIGKPESVELARKAIEMLLSGSKHQTVMNFLRKEAMEQTKFTI